MNIPSVGRFIYSVPRYAPRLTPFRSFPIGDLTAQGGGGGTFEVVFAWTLKDGSTRIYHYNRGTDLDAFNQYLQRLFNLVPDGPYYPALGLFYNPAVRPFLTSVTV